MNDQPKQNMFLTNCWYLAAWGADLPSNGMLARQIAGVYLLFLRDGEGNVSVLHDQCPHRFAPLSRGQFADGKVTCAYHGLQFAGSGVCTHNPHGPISAALTVKRFVAVERYTAIWVWLGSEPADEQKIPDLGYIDRNPQEARVYGQLHSQSDYRLMVDNIMDLTHADFLHASSLGGGINTIAKADVTTEGDTITINWSAANEPLAPLHAQFVGEGDGRGDFLNSVTWYPPSTMRQRLAFSRPGEMATGAQDSMTCHVMTPETATSTHYFFCHTSAAVSANPAIAPMVYDALVHAFAGEDAPMIVAQTSRMGGRDFWSMRPALLPSDKGAVMVRRALDRMIAREQTLEAVV